VQSPGDENPFLRGRALVRLSALHAHGYLTPGETERLAEVYWQQVGADEGLPEVWAFKAWACLTLPEPQPDRAVERFRRYALTAKPPPVQGGMVDPNGLLAGWLQATDIPARTARRLAGQRFVEWTAEEAATLLRTVAEWWETSGRAQAALISSAAPRDVLADEPFRARVEGVLNVLRWIIVPRTSPGSETAGQILALVADFERQGMPVEAVLPALLLLHPDDGTALRLRQALASVETGRYLSALRGLIYWLENQRSPQRPSGAPQLPPPPPELLQGLGTIIARRRQPGLLHALDATAAIFRYLPETTDLQFRQSVAIGLEYLLGETAYRVTEDEEAGILYAEVPNVRARAAEVAVLLRARFDEVIPAVDRWIEATRTDPLPEVREAGDPQRVASASPGGQETASPDATTSPQSEPRTRPVPERGARSRARPRRPGRRGRAQPDEG
jgi:hypothetical protein